MFKLEQSLHAWNTAEFEATLKHELAQNAAHLPLQQALTHGNYALDTPITVIINSVVQENSCINIRAGIIFQSVIAGCSCADDPTPVDELLEHCNVLLQIDVHSGITRISLTD